MAIKKTLEFNIDLLTAGATITPIIVKSETGTIFSITVKENGAVKDVSGATTTKDLNIIQPAETTATVTGAFGTDGTDGVLTFEFVGTEIATAGTYYGEVEMADATDTIKSLKFPFYVKSSVD